MSKRAEQRALEAYPVDICGYTVEWRVGAKPQPQDWNEIRRTHFQDGYEQAEKDLAPLIEAAMIVYEAWNGGTMDDVRKAMAELGKQFKKAKK